MRRTVFAICVAIGGLAATGTAFASVPAATTGAASAITGTTATLNGTVFAGKETTSYHFEYGTTTAYGTQTAAGTVSGNAGKAVSAAISGLAPSTTYHFRLVASNASGPAVGADATFTTTTGGPAPAPTVTIAANPAVVTFGRPVAITGQVPGNPGVKVELEQTPFPFTDPFKLAAEGTTDSAANYSFGVVPALNTKYHVDAKASPPATSADVIVMVRTKVGLRLGDRTPRRGQRVRFRGSVLPAHDGQPVRIQRRTRKGWRTLAQPVLMAATPVNGVARSRYSQRIRIRRSGVYRTVKPADGDHARGKSRKRRARVH